MAAVALGSAYCIVGCSGSSDDTMKDAPPAKPPGSIPPPKDLPAGMMKKGTKPN